MPDAHVTMNGLPLQVFQDAEKRDEIEEVRQAEIAGKTFRSPIMTGASFDPRPRRRESDRMTRLSAQIQLMLEKAPGGILFADLAKSLEAEPWEVSTATGRMGCIKWKVPGTTANGRVSPTAFTMIRLRHADEPIPEIKRRGPYRKNRQPVTGASQTGQAGISEPIPVPSMPKAPPTVTPLVGSIRAEIVLFARAQRRLEKLRLVYQAKIAKLDRIHARNWSKLARRLVLAEPVAKSNGNGHSGAVSVVDHQPTRQG